jgi:hypothetical protein
MPVQATETAGDDHAIRSRCGAMTVVAKDGLSLAVLLSKIINLLIVARAIPAMLSVAIHLNINLRLTLPLEDHPLRTRPPFQSSHQRNSHESTREDGMRPGLIDQD